MCTAITMKAKDGSMLVARTMDFSYPLNPRRIRYEAGRIWKSATGRDFVRVGYSFEGIGQSADPEGKTNLFADGINANGLCAAALYFPGYAKYDKAPRDGRGRKTLAAYEVVPYLLGECAGVRQAVTALKNLCIIGVPDPVTGIAAPLHWLIADCSGLCVTAEKTDAGFSFYDNQIGVLTNSPDFGWHMTNLCNYAGIHPLRSRETDWNGVSLAPFGQGDGTTGLPGDFTPPARFVRAAWLKSHTVTANNYDELLTHAKCILGNVSIPKGCVITERGSIDYTQYTVFFDLTRRRLQLEALSDLKNQSK